MKIALVMKESGEELQPGTEIQSFRDEAWRFCGIEELPTPGKPGTIRAQSPAGWIQIFYTHVFPSVEFRMVADDEVKENEDDSGSSDD